ncbi:hypothetical protein [Streptomyces mangrovi]|uniref:hypothetical protein n=1 Tax=Streptomyces mangrovi TaxID=1206892 RepID=UPI00399D0685
MTALPVAPAPTAPAGTYRNPVLDADWSDPDVIRVGDGHERDAAHSRPAPDGRARLRVELLPGARCLFSARTGDDTGFLPSGPPFAATPMAGVPHVGDQGRVGAQLGLFAAAPGGGEQTGTAAFTRFRVT